MFVFMGEERIAFIPCLAASPDGVTDEFEKVNMTCAPNRISPGTEDGGDVRTRLKKHFVSS
jgi:hypothetical protein